MKVSRAILMVSALLLILSPAALASELRIAQVADIASMDPQKVNDVYSANVIRQVYSNLVQVDENMQIIPDLAESWENPDNLSWVFHLRRGVAFHNGEPVTAADVKFTFDRLKDPSTAAPGATHLKEVKSVEVIDDHTVMLVTARPYAPMLMSLSRYETAILNRKAVEEAGADYGSKVAVGCGPYRFTSWSRGDKVVLDRYDEYFGGPAKIDRLVYRGIPEDATRLIELESGGIDLIPANFPYAEFVNFQGNKGFKTYTCPAMATNYLGLDVAVKPLDNKLARQAINYAVDKQAIVDAVYFGLGMPARGPLSPVIWGFDPNRGDAYPYNPEKARELLAEAGLADGFDMTIFCDARTERTSTAELIQAYLADIGVRASIELMEWSALLSETAKGIGGGFLLGWTGTGDADGGLVPIIHSANIGSSNRFRYSNKNLDDLLDRGGAELDQDARLKIYAEAQELIVDECPLLFLAVQEITAASSKSVEGFRPYPNFIPPLHGVSLSE